MAENENDPMTLPETAAFLDVSLRTIFRYLRRGLLTAERALPGRKVYVYREDAARMLTERYERRTRSE